MASLSDLSASQQPFPPLIDLSPFSQTSKISTLSKQDVADQVHKACLEIGFFQIRSPSLNQTVITDAFEATKEFFNLPLEIKETASAFNSPLFRGYQGITSESHSCTPEDETVLAETKTTTTPLVTAAKRKRDVKESFTIGAKGEGKMLGPNNWPSTTTDYDITSIRERLDKYWDAMLKCSIEIAKALALSLGLPETFFTSNMTNPVAQMVLLRYPKPSESQQACGAHTDCGFLTLLAQDQKMGGLEIQGLDGEWIKATQLEGCVLVNLGDMAANWTNDFYKSTFHRVSNKLQRQRHSIPFFCNLNYDAIVDPRDVCKGPLDVGEPKMKPIKAGDYLCEKLGLMHNG